MAKTELLRLRLTAAELASWKAEAELAGLSLSALVRRAVNSYVKTHTTIRTEDERRRENARLQRIAAAKRAAAEERRARAPTRAELLEQLRRMRP